MVLHHNICPLTHSHHRIRGGLDRVFAHLGVLKQGIDSLDGGLWDILFVIIAHLVQKLSGRSQEVLLGQMEVAIIVSYNFALISGLGFITEHVAGQFHHFDHSLSWSLDSCQSVELTLVEITDHFRSRIQHRSGFVQLALSFSA